MRKVLILAAAVLASSGCKKREEAPPLFVEIPGLAAKLDVTGWRVLPPKQPLRQSDARLDPTDRPDTFTYDLSASSRQGQLLGEHGGGKFVEIGLGHTDYSRLGGVDSLQGCVDKLAAAGFKLVTGPTFETLAGREVAFVEHHSSLPGAPEMKFRRVSLLAKEGQVCFETSAFLADEMFTDRVSEKVYGTLRSLKPL